MKLAHFIELQAFAKPEEDVEAIKKGIIEMMPFDLEKEKVELEEQNATGFHEKIIKIFTITLNKDKHTTKFIKWLFTNLSEHTKQILKTQLDSRIDEDLHFFLRFDKEKWIENKELFLVDHGSCYHLKITFAVFPKSRDNVKEKIKEFLE